MSGTVLNYKQILSSFNNPNDPGPVFMISSSSQEQD